MQSLGQADYVNARLHSLAVWAASEVGGQRTCSAVGVMVGSLKIAPSRLPASTASCRTCQDRVSQSPNTLIFHGQPIKGSHLVVCLVAADTTEIIELPLRSVDMRLDPSFHNELHCIVRHLLAGDIHLQIVSMRHSATLCKAATTLADRASDHGGARYLFLRAKESRRARRAQDRRARGRAQTRSSGSGAEHPSQGHGDQCPCKSWPMWALGSVLTD